MDHETLEKNLQTEDEVSLSDILVFLVHNSKLILLGGVIGLATAFVALMINASYVQTTYVVNDAEIDLPFFKRIQQQIPITAKQESSTLLDADLLLNLQSEKWLNTNLKPIYGLNKQDLKEIGDLKFDPGKIIGFTITNTNKSEANADASAVGSLSILRKAYGYLKLTDFMQSYKKNIDTALTSIYQKRTQNEVDLVYLKKD